MRSRIAILWILFIALFLFSVSSCEANLTEEEQQTIRLNYLLTGLIADGCAEVLYNSSLNYQATVRRVPPGQCSKSTLLGATYSDYVLTAPYTFQKAQEALNLLDPTGSACPATRSTLITLIADPSQAVSMSLWNPEGQYNLTQVYTLPSAFRDFASDSALAAIDNGGVSRAVWNSGTLGTFQDDITVRALEALNGVLINQGETGCVPGVLANLASFFPGFVSGGNQDPNGTPQRYLLKYSCTYGANSTNTCSSALPIFID
ncbi:MAG: hypothetical protein RH862_03600 [Leptospiraceae bacterium]